MSALSRPLLRYLGGKWRIAPWIISHFPAHELYVEPFGGAASVLLRKPPSHGEIWNDLDGDLVNLFAVLRDPASAERLVSLISLTPYSREEFELSRVPSVDPIERARRMVVRSFMGFGSNAANADHNTGFRGDARRKWRTPSQEWGRYPTPLQAIVERVQSGVQLERRDAISLIQAKDGDDVLFYVDPPYVHEARSPRRKRGRLACAYRHELTVEDHVRLLDALSRVRGMVVLSGYPSDLYDAMLPGWYREERPALADGARPRVEVLWINPAAKSANGIDGRAAA